MRLVTGCVLFALAASTVTCRFDKLINPAIRDRLVVSPDSVRELAHSGSSAADTIVLRLASADGATLPWNATATNAWVTLAPTSGYAPDSLVLALNPRALSQAVYTDTIVFTSALAGGRPTRVPVVFEILPPAPELALSDTARTDSAFAGSAEPRTFALRVRNTGALPLTWTATPDTNWITLSDSGGTVPALDSTTVIVTLRAAALAAGTHSGTVTISAPPETIGAPADITVSFRVNRCEVDDIQTLDAVEAGSIALSDCGAPNRPGSQAQLYSVGASAGDTLSFQLTSLEFDAYLIVTDSAGGLLRQNDDCPAMTDTACIVNFPVTVAGRYLIEATTAAAGATGAFSLSLVRERAPAVPQSLRQFRGDSVTPIGTGLVNPENVAVLTATLNDPNPRDSVRLEVELVDTASGFSDTPNYLSGYVGVGRVASIRIAGLTENAAYHWQARTCDRTARCSPWDDFGNVDPAPDFFVNAVPENPAVPAALGQFEADGNTPITLGGGSGGGSVVLKGTISDPDPLDQIRLEVEVRSTLNAFTNTATDASPMGASNRTAAATGPATVLIDYHWQARTCDQTGRCSAWVSFPQPTPNPESNPDYTGTP